MKTCAVFPAIILFSTVHAHGQKTFSGEGCISVPAPFKLLSGPQGPIVEVKKSDNFNYKFKGTEKKIVLTTKSFSTKKEESFELDFDSEENGVIHFLLTIKPPNEEWTYYFARVSIVKKTGKVNVLKDGRPDFRFGTVQVENCKR